MYNQTLHYNLLGNKTELVFILFFCHHKVLLQLFKTKQLTNEVSSKLH